MVESIGVEAPRLLAVIADPVRWRLLAALADRQTRCVCDLQPVAAVAPNLLSYHLRVLRKTGLVQARRRGRWVDYTLAGDALPRLHAAIPRAGVLPAVPASECPPDRSEPVPDRSEPVPEQKVVGSVVR
jgi:ArsR family transcriptional regulator